MILVILAHPSTASFSHAIASTCLSTLEAIGHEVVFHDLYAENFDPVLHAAEIPKQGVVAREIALHCEQLRAADGIIIIHPNWWGQPPAILKGWVDRVVRPGIAYEFLEGDNGEGVPRGLLQARSALVLNTGNTPLDRELSVFGDPLQLLWKNCIFDLCGVRDFHRRLFTVVVTSTLQERTKWLEEVRVLMEKIFPRSVRP